MKKFLGYIMAASALVWNIGMPVLEVAGNFQTFHDFQRYFWPKLLVTLEANWLSNSPMCVILLVGILLLIDSYRPDLKFGGHGLKLSYNSDKYPDCTVITKDRYSGQDFTFHRVRVNAYGNQVIKNCQGYLALVEKEFNGKWIKDFNYTERLVLAWAHEGSNPKDIRPPLSAYLDVIVLDSQQGIALGTERQSYPTSAQNLFEDSGKYKMCIVVSPDDNKARAEAIDIIMERTRHPAKTRLYVEPAKWLGLFGR